MQTSHLVYSFSFILICCASLSCATNQSSNDKALSNEQGISLIEPPPGAVMLSKDKTSALDSLLSDQDLGEYTAPYTGAGSEDHSAKRQRDASARRTDEEVVGSSHTIEDRHPSMLGTLDQELKVVPMTPPEHVPSYTIQSKKIKELFKARQYEEGLIEVNQLLRYYPNAAQLFIMKGTLHSRLGQIDLALRSYERAFQLEPSKRLKAQIQHIQRLIAERESLRKPLEGLVIPGGAEIHGKGAQK